MKIPDGEPMFIGACEDDDCWVLNIYGFHYHYHQVDEEDE